MELNKTYNMPFQEGMKQLKAAYPNHKLIIITDPPYNIGWKYKDYKDKLTEDEYGQMLQEATEDAAKIAIMHYPVEAIKNFVPYLGIPDLVVTWCYNTNLPRQSRHIYIYGQDKVKNVYQDYKDPKDPRNIKLMAEGKRARAYDWWTIPEFKNKTKKMLGNPHNCPIPPLLAQNLVDMLTWDLEDEQYIIVDPFAGSGTVVNAAIGSGHNAIGFEITKEYADYANSAIPLQLPNKKEGNND